MGVEVGVDLVEEVEGRGVALLDCEDEGEGAEACFTLSLVQDSFLFLAHLIGDEGKPYSQVRGKLKEKKEEGRKEGKNSLFCPPLNC